MARNGIEWEQKGTHEEHYYCYETIKHSPVEHLDLVVSIISAIRALSQRGEIPSNMQEYEFKEIMEAIDRVLYTEEWGKLCMDIFVEGIVSEPSEAATKYFFYHPLDLI